MKLPSGEDAPTDALLDWEVPREAPKDWPETAKVPLARFWEARIGRQKEIDASIAAKADFEYLYDKPYVDNVKSPRSRAVHGGEPQPAPHARRRLG